MPTQNYAYKRKKHHNIHEQHKLIMILDHNKVINHVRVWVVQLYSLLVIEAILIYRDDDNRWHLKAQYLCTRFNRSLHHWGMTTSAPPQYATSVASESWRCVSSPLWSYHSVIMVTTASSSYIYVELGLQESNMYHPTANTTPSPNIIT